MLNLDVCSLIYDLISKLHQILQCWNFVNQGLKISFHKTVVSWRGKIQIEFRLLRLKLDLDFFQWYKFQELVRFLWILINFQISLKFKTVLPCSYWNSDLDLRFDWFLIWIWKKYLLESFSLLSLFSNGIRFANFLLMELKLWFFKKGCQNWNFPYKVTKTPKWFGNIF